MVFAKIAQPGTTQLQAHPHALRVRWVQPAPLPDLFHAPPVHPVNPQRGWVRVCAKNAVTATTRRQTSHQELKLVCSALLVRSATTLWVTPAARLVALGRTLGCTVHQMAPRHVNHVHLAPFLL
jgi:hypothetical protein